MRNILLVLLLITSLTTSGCALLLVGAAAGLTIQFEKKAASNPRNLTEEERKKTEYREIKGNKKDVLYAAKQVLKDMGYTVEDMTTEQVENIEQDKPKTNISFGKGDKPTKVNVAEKNEKDSSGDLVTGVIDDPLLRITAVVEKITTDHVGLRLIAENEKGLVENKRLYEVLFDEIIKKLNETKKSDKG